MEKYIFSLRLVVIDGLSLDKIPREILDTIGLDLKKCQVGGKFSVPFEVVFPYIDLSCANVQDGRALIDLTDLRGMFAAMFQTLIIRMCRVFRADHVNDGDVFHAVAEMFEEANAAFAPQARTNWTTVSVDDIETVAHRSFPPCMYNMYMTLKKEHLLKHMGRLQLGLFMKGIGLSLNDSLTVWRNEISKIKGIDGFEKQYAYNIRYNYGKEGSGKVRSPYSCDGMIMRCPAPAPGLTHGCPLRSLDQAQSLKILRAMVGDCQRASGKLHVALEEKLAALAAKGRDHPNIACTGVYNLMHDEEFDGVAVAHPCEFFSQSENEHQKK